MTRRDARDGDLDDELAAHLRLAVADRMARGETRDAAEAAARREFGNLAHIKEVAREQRQGRARVWVERLAQDVRYGVRALRRTPAFTTVAVVTLALAIGANSAVFTVVNSVLLRPLPFPESDRLFLASYLPEQLPYEMSPTIADRSWLPYRPVQRSFEHVTAYNRAAFTMSGVGEATRIVGASVDGSFFAVLRVAPMIGRAFAGAEVRAGNVVVLGEQLWRERFSSDPRILGRSVLLDGNPHTVIGVMPAGFSFPARAALWKPLDVRVEGGNWFLLNVLGRLRAGVTPEQARAELEAIMRRLPRGPGREERMVANILPLKDVVTGRAVTSLAVFSGAVAFVLLIACVNVANLLLIRAATRRREMAVRVALGASRARIARQLLTESLLVGVLGGALGIVLAHVGVRMLIAVAPPDRIPRLEEVHVDLFVLAFTIAVSLVTALFFGIVPALQSARRAPAEAMAHTTRMVGGAQARLRSLLVVGEIAFALVLLAGAGLMIKSFLRLRGADKGYDARSVMTMMVDLPTARYPDAPWQRAFHDRMLGELSRIPGVRRAAAVTFRPMGSVGMMGDFAVEGVTPLPKGYSVDKVLVSPGYFATMGIRLLEGRDFASGDDASAPGAVIVSESVGRKIWPGEDPVGKRVSMDTENPPPSSWLTVVGVVNDVVQDRSMTKRSTMYFPYQQSRWSFILGHMTYVVRADANASVAPALRAALRSVDASVPAQSVMSMDDALLDVAAEPVFQTRVLAVFAALAILLAAIGTYGVLAYDVTERSREIALRMALGAQPSDVIGMVMRRTGALALSGATIGLLGAFAVTRVLTTSLYDVKPTDPATTMVVVVAIVGVALVAGYAPARRASRMPVAAVLPAD